MRAPPTLRGPLPARIASLVLGLAIFAVGVVSLLESNLGLAPWDVLHQGIAERTPLSFGQANIAVGVLVLALAWSLGATVGLGTVANAILVGVFVELLLTVEPVTALSDEGLTIRIFLLVGGVTLLGIGSALYIGAGLGAGPRDSLMVVGARRTPLRIGGTRAAIELTALAVGFALGGTVGLGTVVFALTIGPLVQGSFRLLTRIGLTRPAAPPAEIDSPDASSGRAQAVAQSLGPATLERGAHGLVPRLDGSVEGGELAHGDVLNVGGDEEVGETAVPLRPLDAAEHGRP